MEAPVALRSAGDRIEAIRWTGDNLAAVAAFVARDGGQVTGPNAIHTVDVAAADGTRYFVLCGDWLARRDGALLAAPLDSRYVETFYAPEGDRAVLAGNARRALGQIDTLHAAGAPVYDLLRSLAGQLIDRLEEQETR